MTIYGAGLVELGKVTVFSCGKGDMRYSSPAIFTFGQEQVERNMQIPTRRDNFINNGAVKGLAISKPPA